eukprot:5610649-Amphidinium_carterae.1
MSYTLQLQRRVVDANLLESKLALRARILCVSPCYDAINMKGMPRATAIQDGHQLAIQCYSID